MVLCGELASLLLSELPLNSRFTIGLAKSLQTVDHINNPSLIAPSSALRMSINTGESSFFGEKYLVEKVSIQWVLNQRRVSSWSYFQVFEDDGNFVSGTTAVVHDARRGRLFMHGTYANTKFHALKY